MRRPCLRWLDCSCSVAIFAVGCVSWATIICRDIIPFSSFASDIWSWIISSLKEGADDGMWRQLCMCSSSAATAQRQSVKSARAGACAVAARLGTRCLVHPFPSVSIAPSPRSIIHNPGTCGMWDAGVFFEAYMGGWGGDDALGMWVDIIGILAGLGEKL